MGKTKSFALACVATWAGIVATGSVGEARASLARGSFELASPEPALPAPTVGEQTQPAKVDPAKVEAEWVVGDVALTSPPAATASADGTLDENSNANLSVEFGWGAARVVRDYLILYPQTRGLNCIMVQEQYGPRARCGLEIQSSGELVATPRAPEAPSADRPMPDLGLNSAVARYNASGLELTVRGEIARAVAQHLGVPLTLTPAVAAAPSAGEVVPRADGAAPSAGEAAPKSVQCRLRRIRNQTRGGMGFSAHSRPECRWTFAP